MVFSSHIFLFYFLPLALLLSPLERRSAGDPDRPPGSARQIIGAMMLCLGIALLAMYGFGGGPMEYFDWVSFALVIVGA